jgi:hypothetical protein
MSPLALAVPLMLAAPAAAPDGAVRAVTPAETDPAVTPVTAAPDLVLHPDAAPDLGLSVPAAARPRDELLFGREMLAASGGILVADTAVILAGYGMLQLFAHGVISPTAPNFRAGFLGLGAAALVVPPLTAALFARWARAAPGSGAWWKAFLFSVVGNAAALAAGYLLAPAFWAVVPVQLATIPIGASLGLHW